VKFGRIVVQVNTHRLRSQTFDTTLHFQDGSHDVSSSISSPIAAVSAHWVHVTVTSLAHCMRFLPTVL